MTSRPAQGGGGELQAYTLGLNSISLSITALGNPLHSDNFRERDKCGYVLFKTSCTATEDQAKSQEPFLLCYILCSCSRQSFGFAARFPLSKQNTNLLGQGKMREVNLNR